MTKWEADKLTNDLKAINVDVRAVKLNEKTVGREVYCWFWDPAEWYWVQDASLFRDAVRECGTDPAAASWCARQTTQIANQVGRE